MIIAVNTRFLIANKLEGIGWFTFETMKRITRAHPEHEFHFFFDRPYNNEFIFSNNITPHILYPPARHPLLWYWWFEYSVPRKLKAIKADLFISTDGFLSLSTQVKQHLVIHDLAYLHYPDHVNRSALKYYQRFMPRYVNKATRIATVSQFSGNDIQRAFQYPADKIDVVCNGAHEFFKPISEEEKIQVRQRYTGGAPYFIYAGAIHPRKNVETLFRAFDKLKTEYQVPHKLIIAGRFAWKTGEVQAIYEQLPHKADILFTGHLGRNELARITAASYAMVYISLFEGFGIPLVEAMQCGVPCITSNVSSMPEVCGDAGILIHNPKDVNEVVAAMYRMIDDKSYYQTLSERAPGQAAKFSWDKSAVGLWESVRRCL